MGLHGVRSSPYRGGASALVASAEPTGMTLLSSRPFSTLAAGEGASATVPGGWLGVSEDVGGPWMSLSTDATAPQSPSSIAGIRFATGYAAGNSPASTEIDISPGSARVLYTAYWIRYSANWWGQATGTNKQVHFFVGSPALNRVYTNASCVGAGDLLAYVSCQNINANYNNGIDPPSTSLDLPPNLVPGSKFVRGQWHKAEYVFTCNTGGLANGSLEWWLDGVKIGAWFNINIVAAGATWQVVKWDPTWGGLGGTVPADQYLYMDHVYLSGKV